MCGAENLFHQHFRRTLCFFYRNPTFALFFTMIRRDLSDARD